MYSNNFIQEIQNVLIEAGEYIRSQQQQIQQEHISWKSPDSPVTVIDTAAQQMIEERLRLIKPDYPVISEELTEQEQNRRFESISRNTFFLVDPLDGTFNYMSGIPLYAVSITFILNGITELGFIYDPVRNEMFTAQRGKGATLNNQSIHCNSPRPYPECVIAVRPRHLPPDWHRFYTQDIIPNVRRIRELGTACLMLAWVACGRFDVSIHSRVKAWDVAAGSLLIQEAGGKCSQLDGESLRFVPPFDTEIIAVSSTEVYQQLIDRMTAIESSL